ncbi:signal peptidase I [Aurantimonas sp. MSK8Z-1]|uniref:signal peptidase I n=1 Tax=Mangrovibrevibacter kandeliae TaxID=2968473 RepID=UPI0021192CEA|nr:signal peptidase I [Aurantimonas sp. MSK8Z-1]MCW4115769.1 signal peptidase I [Aurantimonas sp. MSK8Z-1]
MRRALIPVLFLLLCPAGPAFAVETITIPGDSMLPTLGAGDVVTAGFDGVDDDARAQDAAAAQARDPASAPKRGDILVFRTPDGSTQVDRLIGLPGDRVQMQGGIVVLNAVPLRTELVQPLAGACMLGRDCSFLRETLPGGRSYVIERTVAHAPNDETAEVTVPPGHYYVLGDNRTNALDSRFVGTTAEAGDFFPDGLVPEGAVLGHLKRILKSPRPGETFERLAGFPRVEPLARQ